MSIRFLKQIEERPTQRTLEDRKSQNLREESNIIIISCNKEESFKGRFQEIGQWAVRDGL